MNENDYLRGQRSVAVRLLRLAMEMLGYPLDDEHLAQRLISERESAIATLRRVCEHHGDNDWPDNLHLGDVIEKHLERHLEYRD